MAGTLRPIAPTAPLVLLATEEAIYAYVAVLWTTNAENIDRLHAQLSAVLPDAYLGNLCHQEYLDIEKFQEVFRPLSLPVWGSFFDGASQQE